MHVLVLMLELWSSTCYIIWRTGIHFGFVNFLVLVLELWNRIGYIIVRTCIGIYVGVVGQYLIHTT